MYAETLFLPHTDVKPDTRCVPKTDKCYSEIKKIQVLCCNYIFLFV